MSVVRICVAILLVMSFLRHSHAAEIVKIATGEFPPLYTEHTKDNGKVLNVVREAFKAVGLEIEYHFFPWARANHYAKNEGFDASCCWFPQKERELHGHYSQNVYPYTYSFFHLKSTPFDWKKIDDLQRYRIGGTISYTYTKEFVDAEKDNTIDVRRVSSDLQNLKKLLSERIDIFPLNLDVGKYMLKQNFPSHQANLVTYHRRPLVNDFVHLVFPKVNQRSQKLLEKFNEGMRLIKENGRYLTIKNM